MPQASTVNTVELEMIRAPVTDDLTAVDSLISKELASSVPLIEEVILHILKSGGKRVRPLLLLLSCRACGYDGDDIEHHELAAIIEFIHTSTLLHDDVVDNSELRRGEKTANAVWNNSASVLVGDFLYSRAFQILARRSNIPVMKTLADTTNQIAEGEMLQLASQHKVDCSIKHYYRVIEAKTAALFAAAAEIGARIAQPNNCELHQAMHKVGWELGIAFQIIDDLLDYVGDSETTGKNLGDDLQEGKLTMPVIYAINAADTKKQTQLKTIIKNGELDSLPTIINAITQSDACAKTREQARSHLEIAQETLKMLPSTPHLQAIKDLLTFVEQRAY